MARLTPNEHRVATLSAADTLSAESVWHERLSRRRESLSGSARGRLLIHQLLVAQARMPRQLERIDPDGRSHWRPMPPDRERETRRVLDELGTLAGIGP